MNLKSLSKTNSQKVGFKECKTCKKLKPFEDFYTGINPNGKKYTDRACRPCANRERNKRKGKTPQRFIKHLVSQLKYKRKETHIFQIDANQLIKLYNKQKGRCALSGEKMTHTKDGTGYHYKNISIDRINPKRGYIIENIQLVCYAINMMKWVHSNKDLIKWCERVAKHKGAGNNESKKQAITGKKRGICPSLH